jgi:hypothetical protein
MRARRPTPEPRADSGADLWRALVQALLDRQAETWRVNRARAVLAGSKMPIFREHLLRPATAKFIIDGSITGGLAVCHDWWFKRRDEEDRASRRMWDEFERTRPLSDPEVTEEEPEVTLEERETARLTAKD